MKHTHEPLFMEKDDKSSFGLDLLNRLYTVARLLRLYGQTVSGKLKKKKDVFMSGENTEM